MFFHEKGSKHIFVHFETAFDAYILQDLIESSDFEHFLTFHSDVRTRFARYLLLATQICHIVLFVEPSSTFDASYLTIFKALKILREKYVLKFLPKLLRNTPIGSTLNKEARLCSPRFIFFFEKSGRPIKDMGAHSIGVEDDIFQMLRTNFIITNNSQLSLFSIPKNKKFLFINTDEELNVDPVVESLDLLLSFIDGDTNNSSDVLQFKPHRGYGINYLDDVHTVEFDTRKKRTFYNLLMEYVDEALNYGFDDSVSKYRGKNHFVWPSGKTWHEVFRLMHTIFIENALNESFQAKNADYKEFLENFHTIIDVDQQLFIDSTKHGFDLALNSYSELLPHHYSANYHEAKLAEAVEVFQRYARGPDIEKHEIELRDQCLAMWMNGKQQCEVLSLRANPCVMIAKHATSEGSMHSSGVTYISVCNCGRMQGIREDPYTIKKANYEFYQIMSKNCVSCEKADIIEYPTFLPSEGTDFKAAQVNKTLAHLFIPEDAGKTPPAAIVDHHLSASQKTQADETNLSLGSSDDENDNQQTSGSEDEEDINEIVVKIGEMDVKDDSEVHATSKTEYLPGMLLQTSPIGLLPEFPSWSLLRIAHSSMYGHNTGLTEKQMPGFLSGSNFLLPWDVKVRLERSENKAEFEKNRSRKRQKQTKRQPAVENDSASYFTLKVFLGMEYECGRGHRFFMSSNDTVMKGVSGGSKTSGCGGKLVFNDMPLIFPCPCKNSVAQLLRVHIVTPKAPVNIHIDPKIKIRRESEMVFVSGWNEPAKLSQSAYWVLRLPFAYIGEDEPVQFPHDFQPSEALRYGCLMQGMFGIKESEAEYFED